MNHEQMNGLLKPNYETYYTELLQIFDDEVKNQLSLPLLMHVFPEYDVTQRKLLIVGKETRGWGSKLTDSTFDVDRILNSYIEFELGKRYRNSPFWRFSKNLFKLLNPSNNPNGLLWTNLSKFSQYEGPVADVLKLKNKSGYDLLTKEIEITQPEIIIFLTSHNQDLYLNQTFSDLEYLNIEGLDPKYLVRLKSSKLPYHTFRTYHPRFLNSQRSKYKINDIIDKIHVNLN